MDVMKNLPQNLKKNYLVGRGLQIEELKVLVATCSQLEDLFLHLGYCSCFDNSTCRHFDEVITILFDSSLSDTLIIIKGQDKIYY